MFYIAEVQYPDGLDELRKEIYNCFILYVLNNLKFDKNVTIIDKSISSAQKLRTIEQSSILKMELEFAKYKISAEHARENVLIDEFKKIIPKKLENGNL